MLRRLVVILLIGGLLAIAPGEAMAALSLSNDQADDSAPNGAPLSAETQRLFQAVRDGDLAGVQQAVLDDADIRALNAEGITAANLAESLHQFTITHFLRAYQAIEERSGAPTTVVETEEPAPLPPPDAEAPSESVTSMTPVSGEGVVDEGYSESGTSPDVVVTVEENGSASEAVSADTPLSEISGDIATSVSPVTVGELPDGEGLETQSGDYFTRLSVLNPTPEPPQTAASEAPAPSGQIVEGGDDLESLAQVAGTATAITEEVADPSVSSEGLKVAAGEQTLDEEELPAGAFIESGDLLTAFAPGVPSRKPDDNGSADEPAIFSSVEEVDVLMLAEAPSVPEPAEADNLIEPEEDSFFDQMRVFAEDPSAKPLSDEAEIPDLATITENIETVPEYEQIRAAVIEKLRRESDERSQQLAGVRDETQQDIEKDSMIRQQESGSLNIQTELRAKQRTVLTGTDLPPGYAPPPDGGSSGLRFLKRLGLYDEDEPVRYADSDDVGETGLPAGSSSYGESILMEAGESILLQVPTPRSLAKKSVEFADQGYSAPPAGQTLDTADDTAVAALAQIARLFQTPAVGYSGQTGTLPVPGSLTSPTQMQSLSPGITLPQAYSGAALNADDLVTPLPSISSPVMSEIETPPVAVPEIPVGSSGLAQLSDPYQDTQPEELSGWDATAIGSQSGTVGDTPAITEATGTWDVVSVQAAPTASRTLLGGAIVPKTSMAVAGANALSMGRSVVLGKAPPVSIDPVARKKACIDKRRGVILFCIESVDWPSELGNIMQVDTVMYQGLNAIVRYDNGAATRFHALFPSESFNTVVNYYMQRLGNPTNAWQRTITPLAAPERENPTVSWQAQSPLTQAMSILEIRQFDDTRGGFPDEKRGAVMLYSAQSGPIFPQVSAFELMRLHPGS